MTQSRAVEDWERDELISGSTFVSESTWGLYAPSLTIYLTEEDIVLSYDSTTDSFDDHFDLP